MSTFLPETYVELIARKLNAKHAERLSVESLIELREVHRERGEMLSVRQYDDLLIERGYVEVENPKH